MASAFGLSSNKSDSKTTDKSITAQDSTISQDSNILGGSGSILDGSGANAFANSTINVTDGGAFKTVENVAGKMIDGVGDAVKSVASMLGNWVKEQNSFAISSTTSLLNSARVANQESALTAQENTMNFFKIVVIGGAAVAVVYLVVKYGKNK